MSTEAAIKATMSVARDLAEGNLDAADLDATAVAEAASLFATVVGPSDPVWPAQVDVARRVLALGGVPVDELAEWLAVAQADTDAP